MFLRGDASYEKSPILLEPELSFLTLLPMLFSCTLYHMGVSLMGLQIPRGPGPGLCCLLPLSVPGAQWEPQTVKTGQNVKATLPPPGIPRWCPAVGGHPQWHSTPRHQTPSALSQEHRTISLRQWFLSRSTSTN